MLGEAHFSPATSKRAKMDINWRLLLVDDETVALDLGTKLLDRIGFKTVDIATSGRSALAQMESNTYRAVISDWNMPEMNGLDLLCKIRRDDRLRKTPFLMTSVDGDIERVRVARKFGVDAFLLKPFDAQALRTKMSEVLGHLPEVKRAPLPWPVQKKSG
jgi:two-component system, chemotaxis family, chemotaxis protein CheY